MTCKVRSRAFCSLALLVTLATFAALAQTQSSGAPNRVDITRVW